MPLPPLDFQSPQPPQRVGFLSKCNPSATAGSVVRKAVTYGMIAASMWFVAAYFNPAARENWQFILPTWVCIAAFVGAVFEWQQGDEELL